MPVCPWCQADVYETRFPCPSCGRRPKDHVSQMMRKVEAPVAAPPAPAAPVDAAPEIADLHLELGDGHIGARAAVASDVPDLALALPPPRRPPPAAAAPAPAPSPEPAPPDPDDGLSLALPAPKVAAPRKAAAAAVQPSFDDGVDFHGDGGGAIDLDVRPEPEPPRAPPGGGSGAPGPRSASGAPESLPAASGPGSALLQSEDGGQGAAERLAGYGPPPAEWWRSPVYAYSVKMRQMSLRRDLVTRRADLEKAHAAADDALVVLAERARKLADQKPAYGKLVDAVKVAEADLRARDSALAAEAEAHAKKTAALDERVGKLEAEAAGARAEERSLRDYFNRVDDIRQRAEAKLKRAEIELRSAVARASGGPVDSSGPAAVRKAQTDAAMSDPEVVSRAAERDARQAEVSGAMPAVTEANQKLTAARRKLASIEEPILAAKNQRAALEDEFRKRGATHGAEVEKGQTRVRAAMAALGRSIVADREAFGAEWEEARREIASLDQVTAARDDEVMLHVMAVDAYDRKSVQTGLALIVGALALVMAVALLPVLVFARPAPKPPAATLPAAVDPE